MNTLFIIYKGEEKNGIKAPLRGNTADFHASKNRHRKYGSRKRREQKGEGSKFTSPCKSFYHAM